MLKDEIFQALNEQIKHEFHASYLYLSIASYFENIPLDGIASWFRKQAEEEHEHAMKIYEFINDRSRQVELQAIPQPITKFNSIEEVFELTLAHEKKVTKWIHEIYEMAQKEQDHATAVFLHWFITEQVEEEKNAEDNLDQIKLIGDDKAALFVLDQNFAKRED